MENEIITPKRNLPRDVFLHFLAIITLYWSAVSFITLLWQFINYFLPDLLRRQYGDSFYYLEPMRFAVASLIIVFPVFTFVSWYLNRNYNRNPEIREMKLRKWLIYFTLFVASLIIIGDLVSVILTFLRGDITSRFILKALSVLFVAMLIFGYYLNDVRKKISSPKIKYFVSSVCVIVLIAVVGAFFVVGSPKEQRLKSFDDQKINDLQNIQTNIVNYWQKKEKLPEKLTDLNDAISGFIVPVDSQTGESYEYNIKDYENLVFKLCATFNKAGISETTTYSVPIPGKEIYSQNWGHEAGKVCFERTIDKELYPPKKD